MFEEQEQSAETLNSEAADSTVAEDTKDLATQIAEDDAQNLDADSQEQTDEEEEEIEVGDKKLALPKSIAEKLKSERLMHADYTQKTQGLAVERQQVQAEREQNQRQANDQQAYVNEMAKLVSIDEQLAAYNAIDWNALINTDPQEALRFQQQQRALEGQRNQAAQSLTQKQQQIALNQQQDLAKRVQDAEAYMKREIPGFSPERSNELQKYAVAKGMSAEAVAEAIVKAPAVAVLMHKADLYDKLLAKQAPKPPQVAAAKPAIRVGSNATVKKDPSAMTDAEFAAYRRRTSSRK